jgi:hypothetical protein
MRRSPHVPTVACFLIEAESRNEVPVYAFWCSFCDRWHTHGAVSEGNRSPHCISPESPFKRTGYNLKCVGKLPRKLFKRDGSLKNLTRTRAYLG